MRPFDSLKAYIGHFQSQLTKLHNCIKDVSALAFNSGLRVTYSLYKYLVKYSVTCWSDVLYRAQPYIQLEKAMKNFTNQSLNRCDDGEKSKLHHGGPSIDNQGRG